MGAEASATVTETAIASGPPVSSGEGGGIGLRMGFGQMGLVVIGSVTSIAGAIVLGRLWIQRRHRPTNGSGDGS